MKSRFVAAFVFVVLIVFCFSSSNATADNIVIAADAWCPYNCEPGTAKPGYMVEIAQKAFASHGHTVRYQIIPWERAVQEGRSGKLTGIIGAYKDDAPDFIYPNSELAMVVEAFYVLNEKDWEYKDLSSLDDISLGAIKGYAYGLTELNTYIEKNANNIKKVQLAFGDTALETNIKKILGGRIDAIVSSQAVFLYKTNQMNVKDKFKMVGKVGTANKAYIAFSPTNPKSKQYAQILSDYVDSLRSSGELKTILKKYGLEDWK